MFAFQCTFKTELLCVDMMTFLSFFFHVGPMPTKLWLWHCITIICSYCKSLLTGHTTYIFYQHHKSIFYCIYVHKTVHKKITVQYVFKSGFNTFSVKHGVKKTKKMIFFFFIKQWFTEKTMSLSLNEKVCH